MSHHHKKLGSRMVHRLKLGFLVFSSLALIGASGVLLWATTLELPDFSAFGQRKVAQSTKIYDRTGKVLLYDVHGNIQRTEVPFSEISDNIKRATLAIEDTDFYSHRGVQPKAILRAVLANLSSGSSSQGGSTITQQVVKNSLLTKDKNYTRKIKEALIALKLEKSMSKDQIFSHYLNESPYGGNMYGVEEASQAFFGKKASEVSVAEGAYLAALPKAPSYFSPYGPNKDKLDERKNLVLWRMKQLNILTQEEYDQALAEKVEFKPDNTGGVKAPHFVFYVRSLLEEKYGRDAIENQGFRVITSLDWKLQEKAEELTAKYAKENEKNFNAKNASMVGIDPKTGQILVMVGSRDYFEEGADGNFNIAISHRQPGSAFKPFVYAAAFEKGYLPETVLFDTETQFDTSCSPEGVPLSPGKNCYTPENYDHIYRGPISLRNALAQSVNIPAIKTLYLVGIADAIKTAKALGITTLTNPNRYGLTLVLGGGEVSLLEMTSAYGTLANDGMRNPYASILRIEDETGTPIEEFTPAPERAISENVARQISDVLSDNTARAPAFGENSALRIPGRDVAVKTGTTNDYKDAWIVGYTPNFALGAWAGNNDNTPMEKKVAGFIIAPLWNEMMREALKTIPDEGFIAPEKPANYSALPPVIRGIWQGGDTYVVNKNTGNLAAPGTPAELTEERAVTSIHTILYWIDRKNPLGPRPSNPENDPQFNLWETSVRKWATEKGHLDQATSSKPTVTDSNTAGAPTISILSPSNGSAIAGSTRNTGTVLVTNSNHAITQADFFVNSTYIGSAKSAPYSVIFVPQEIAGIKNVNQFRVVVFDAVGNKSEATSTFSII